MHKKGSGICLSKAELETLVEACKREGMSIAFGKMSDWLRKEIVHHACNAPLAPEVNRVLFTAAEMSHSLKLDTKEPGMGKEYLNTVKVLKEAA